MDAPKPIRGWAVIEKGKLRRHFYESLESVACYKGAAEANAALRSMFRRGQIVVPADFCAVKSKHHGYCAHYQGEWIYGGECYPTKRRALESAATYFGLISFGLKGNRAERFRENVAKLLEERGVKVARVAIVPRQTTRDRNPTLKPKKTTWKTWDQQAAEWCQRPQHPDLEIRPAGKDDRGNDIEHILYRGHQIGLIHQPWPDSELDPVYGHTLFAGKALRGIKDCGGHLDWDGGWRTPADAHNSVRWNVESRLEPWEAMRRDAKLEWQIVKDSLTAIQLLCNGKVVAWVYRLLNTAGKLADKWVASVVDIVGAAGVVYHGSSPLSKSFRHRDLAQGWCVNRVRAGLTFPPLWTPACVHPVEVWEQGENTCFVRVTMPDRYYVADEDGKCGRYALLKDLQATPADDTGKIAGAAWLIPLSVVVDLETALSIAEGEYCDLPISDMTREQLRGLIYANEDHAHAALDLEWRALEPHAIHVSGADSTGWCPPDDELWAVEEMGGKLDLVTWLTPREQRQSDRVLWSNTDPATWTEAK